MKREGLQKRWPLTPFKPELLWFWASGAGPALYKAIAWEWKVFTQKRVPNNCSADRWSLSCAWRSCNLLESTQTMKEVGVPISISQEKRPRLDEVKEHAPDHVPIAKNPENGLLEKLEAPLGPNDPDICFCSAKGSVSRGNAWLWLSLLQFISLKFLHNFTLAGLRS